MTAAEMVVQSPEVNAFELDQRRASAYAESGYWPDAAKLAQALVKIEAGRSLGLSPLAAMSGVHVIDGKPSVGSHLLGGLVKAHPRYDYRVVDITDLECEIAFYEAGEHVGSSRFTKADADQAELTGRSNWKKYPRNMLFARAMSNGVAWFAPDVTMGRVYTGDEIDTAAPPPPLPEEAIEIVDIDGEEIPWPDIGELDAAIDPSLFPPAAEADDEPPPP